MFENAKIENTKAEDVLADLDAGQKMVEKLTTSDVKARLAEIGPQPDTEELGLLLDQILGQADKKAAADGSFDLMTEHDAKNELAIYQLYWEDEKGQIKTRDGFDIWKRSPRRRKYEGITFNPNVATVAPNILNYFKGFGVTAKEGDCSKFLAHIREIVCRGNEEHYNYLIGVTAQMVQEPWSKPGVAVVLRGRPGTGKSTLSYWIAHIIGNRHSLVVEKATQWVGRFNAQLRNKIFLAGEEAAFAGNHEFRNSMKHLITSELMTYEAKGQDIEDGEPNYTRVYLTTNEDWAIPAEWDDRRYFVLDVSDARMKDIEYFAAINDEIKNGGAEAFMDYLMKVDYSKIDLRNPPMTKALREQILRGLNSETAWFVSILTEGVLPDAEGVEEHYEWNNDTKQLAIPCVRLRCPIKVSNELRRGD